MIKLSKNIITQPDFIKKLVNIKDYPELKHQLKEHVPIVTVNGIQTICSDFQKFITETDPSTVCLFEGINYDYTSNIDTNDGFNFSFINIHIFDVFKTIIAELTYDVMSSKNTWDEYIDCVKRLGFEEIHSFNVKKSSYEQDHFIFWSNTYHMLWHIDSYSEYNGEEITVNSSTLYLNGKPKNDNFNHLPYSGGFVSYSNVLEASFDMRNLPSKKLFNILSCITPVQYWFKADIYLPMQSELNNLPDYVKKFVFSKQSSFCNKEIVVHSNMHSDILDFIEKEITQEDLVLIFNFIQLYSDSKQENVLPLIIIEKMNHFLGCSDDHYKACLANYCRKKYNDLSISYNHDLNYSALDELMDVLQPIELLQYYKETKLRDNVFRDFFIKAEQFKRLEKFVSDLI